MFSRWQTYEAVQRACRGQQAMGVELGAFEAELEKLEVDAESWRATIAEVGSSEGQDLVAELDLVAWTMRDALQSRADAYPYSGPGCVQALELLQLARDPEKPDTITVRNRPLFATRLSARAICANRYAEARLLLRRLVEMDGALVGTERSIDPAGYIGGQGT